MAEDRHAARLKAAVREGLEAGEEIRIVTRPEPLLFTSGARIAFAFALFWTLFSLFWTWGFAGFTLPDFSRGLDSLRDYPKIGFPFILVGFWMLPAPWWWRRKARNTRYVLTNKRIRVLTSGRWVEEESMALDRILDVSCSQEEGTTWDIRLAVMYPIKGSDRVTTGSFTLPHLKNPKAIVKHLTNS